MRKNDRNVVNTGVKTSMERLGECHGRDSLRNTMLKHEEIFRQQVTLTQELSTFRSKFDSTKLPMNVVGARTPPALPSSEDTDARADQD